MPPLKRVALVVALAFGGSLALAAATIAAGGGLAPGDYVFTSVSANAEFGAAKGGPPDQPTISVFVNRGLNSYQPEHPKGPKIVSNSTMVQLSIFTATSGASGCWVIDPKDFTVSKNLQTAALHTTLTADNVCPGFAAPVTGTSVVTPFAGGGGGGGGFTLPMTLDLTWTGNGVTSVGKDRSTFSCLDYSAASTDVIHSSNASASATLSGIPETSPSDLASISSDATHIDINGTPQPACIGF